MRGISQYCRGCLRTLGLIILTINVVLVSIPRCDLIFSLLQDQSALATAASDASCHENPVPQNGKTTAFTAQRFCECTLLAFVAFPLPQLNLHEHVQFRIQSERLISFSWKAFQSQFQPLVEPPYPKA